MVPVDLDHIAGQLVLGAFDFLHTHDVGRKRVEHFSEAQRGPGMILADGVNSVDIPGNQLHFHPQKDGTGAPAAKAAASHYIAAQILRVFRHCPQSAGLGAAVVGRPEQPPRRAHVPAHCRL